MNGIRTKTTTRIVTRTLSVAKLDAVSLEERQNNFPLILWRLYVFHCEHVNTVEPSHVKAIRTRHLLFVLIGCFFIGKSIPNNLSTAIIRRLSTDTKIEISLTKLLSLQVIVPNIPSTNHKLSGRKIFWIWIGIPSKGKNKSEMAMFTMKKLIIVRSLRSLSITATTRTFPSRAASNRVEHAVVLTSFISRDSLWLHFAWSELELRLSLTW